MIATGPRGPGSGGPDDPGTAKAVDHAEPDRRTFSRNNLGFAPAKVNLALHVTGRRSDGYHFLDSLVAFADVGDGLTAGPGDALSVIGPFAAGVPVDHTNLIRRALALAGTPRAVVLDKQLPHPAGLGGGSSDAAAALRLVGAAPTVADLLSLGADVPVCMDRRSARMQGVGEIVTSHPVPPLAAILLHPGVALPTAAVFARLASTDNPEIGLLPRRTDAADFIDWLV
ncbi:MAG: hypothetical protein WBA25_18780, partial [Jannaschia sp.]